VEADICEINRLQKPAAGGVEEYVKEEGTRKIPRTTNSERHVRGFKQPHYHTGIVPVCLPTSINTRKNSLVNGDASWRGEGTKKEPPVRNIPKTASRENKRGLTRGKNKPSHPACRRLEERRLKAQNKTGRTPREPDRF